METCGAVFNFFFFRAMRNALEKEMKNASKKEMKKERKWK
jgi:hypothetical protein